MELWNDVLKTSWKYLCKTSYGQDEYIGLNQDVLKTRKARANIFVLIKTFSEDENEKRLQDVFIKTNVCWEVAPNVKFNSFISHAFLYSILYPGAKFHCSSQRDSYYVATTISSPRSAIGIGNNRLTHTRTARID